jgi:peptidyl-tRNA hydrolase
MDEPVLYILVRSDVCSLKGELSHAQIAHAANRAVHHINVVGNQEHCNWLTSWESVYGFGVTIVLDSRGTDLVQLATEIRAIGLTDISDIVEDLDYPVRDGAVTHRIPFITCAYAFGMKSKLEPFFKRFSLY